MAAASWLAPQLPSWNRAWKRTAYGHDALHGVPLSKVFVPGVEGDYNGWRVQSVQIAPVLQDLGSYRGYDHGAEANPDEFGYIRAMLAPVLSSMWPVSRCLLTLLSLSTRTSPANSW